jgi:2,4-dienoyl-CoA reductase-like NADH-dependent reductase (Old Yellow Enzyme family)
MPEFTRLFETGKIGNIKVKNKIIMPPYGTHYSSLDGHITDRQATYYGEALQGSTWSSRKSGTAWNPDVFGKPLKKEHGQRFYFRE